MRVERVSYFLETLLHLSTTLPKLAQISTIVTRNMSLGFNPYMVSSLVRSSRDFKYILFLKLPMHWRASADRLSLKADDSPGNISVMPNSAQAVIASETVESEYL